MTTVGFYAERVLPKIINVACANASVREQRERVVPLASGRVLEVGMGSALNLPYYNRDTVETVWGLEPSEGMRKLAEPRIAESDLDIRLLGLRGEEIPLDDDSIDSIVLTYTLCTIPDWRTALDQMRRVLTPDGKMYFSEHGHSDEPKVAKWQDRINPIWNRIAGGCNLNRPIQQCLEETGFAMESVTTEARGAPKFATFTYWGVAAPIG